jgi:site-specific recombinase XerC
MKIVRSNPCDALERPKVTQGMPRGLSADQIRRLLAVVPSTPVGLRDRAIILTLVMTGRRRAEVLGMTAGSISVEDRVFYTYRGKGGKTVKRELPQPAYDAITGWLAALGRSLEAIAPDDDSLWPDIR